MSKIRDNMSKIRRPLGLWSFPILNTIIEIANNEPSSVSDTRIDNRVPMEATRVITTVNNGSSTQGDLFEVTFSEGF